VSAAFDFLDRLLAEQRKFAGELIKSTAPLRTTAKPGAAEPAEAAEAAEPAEPAEPAGITRQSQRH
jgi:hypothetical protein